MTVFLWKQKLSYIAVPKVACTSLKTMFFEVENDRPFVSFRANGKWFHIHRFYKAVPFAELPRKRIADHVRLTVVRDPIRRFLSCYSNRVIFHKELSEKFAGPALARAGLTPDPDLSLFIDRFEDYCRAVSSIGHHARPMVEYLGTDPAFYTEIYPIERVGEMVASLETRLGRKLVLPRLQTGGPKIDPDVLTPAQIDKLRAHYAQDYDIWGRHI